jgi:hypothetical protein
MLDSGVESKRYSEAISSLVEVLDRGNSMTGSDRRRPKIVLPTS